MDYGYLGSYENESTNSLNSLCPFGSVLTIDRNSIKAVYSTEGWLPLIFVFEQCSVSWGCRQSYSFVTVYGKNLWLHGKRERDVNT